MCPASMRCAPTMQNIGGKLVVIGSKLDEAAIAALFGC